jgi:D-alanyl-D-alanine carboxypeptidase
MHARPRRASGSPARERVVRHVLARPVAIAAAAFALAFWSFAIAAPAPASAADPHVGPPPECELGDVPTELRSYLDWQRTIVDTTFRLPASYAPPDLVPVSRAGLAGSGAVRRLVIADLAALARAARRDGVPLAAISGYRSFGSQAGTFAHWVGVLGFERARLGSARAGHSEHQLGTTLDFASYPGGEPWYYSWFGSRTARWLAANAWRYGFVMSYPPDRTALTCYQYEPWHFRYLGRELAATIHASGLTAREFLWARPSTPRDTASRPPTTSGRTPATRFQAMAAR